MSTFSLRSNPSELVGENIEDTGFEIGDRLAEILSSGESASIPGLEIKSPEDMAEGPLPTMGEVERAKVALELLKKQAAGETITTPILPVTQTPPLPKPASTGNITGGQETIPFNLSSPGLAGLNLSVGGSARFIAPQQQTSPLEKQVMVEQSTAVEEFATPTIRTGPSPIPAGYPHPSLILTDGKESNALLNSGYLLDLRSVEYHVMLNSGSKTVITDFGRIVCDVYEQFCIAFMARYYSTLPSVEYDELAFQGLHVMLLAAASPSTCYSAKYGDLSKMTDVLTSHNIGHIFAKVARMLIAPDAAVSSDITLWMTPSDCANALTTLKREYPAAVIVYRVMYQIVHGGPECVAPIPETLYSNDLMHKYLLGVCKGYGSLTAQHVSIEARSPQLKFIAPVAVSQVPLTPTPAGLMKEKESEKEPEIPVGYTGETPKTADEPTKVPPPRVNDPVTQSSTTKPGIGYSPIPPSQFPASSSGTANRQTPPSSGVPPPYQPEASARHAHEFRTSQLLPQGIPPRVQINRNTSDFFNSALSETAIREMEARLSAMMSEGLARIEGRFQVLDALANRIGSIESSMAILIAQKNMHDLDVRTDMNRSLFSAPSSGVQIPSHQAPTPIPVVLDEQARLIQRIKGFGGLAVDPKLPDDVREFFIKRHDINTAESILRPAFTTAVGRRRILERVEMAPSVV